MAEPKYVSIDEGQEIKMICEHEGCSSTNVKDYKRRKEDAVDGWDDEPIALCKDHADNREPIVVNPFSGIGDN